MKKFLVFAFVCAFCINCSEARDYAKMQIKEMKHAQKYATTQKVLNKNTNISTNLPTKPINTLNVKDPGIMKFGNYDKISSAKYNEKLKQDEVKYEEYATQLGKKHSKYYTTQADAEDFYKVYRIAERIIRANNLDYINWRICLKKDVKEVNASSDGANLITITTAMFDTFSNNDNALALIIGHEMGHTLLGHWQRSAQLLTRMNRFDYKRSGNNIADTVDLLIYTGMRKKYLIDSKNMEYAADVEGAKLALHAGYDLNSGADVLYFLSNYDIAADFRRTHPNSAKRLENFNENIKYFPSGWKDMGEYNIYNSDVLPVQLSSDRKSIVISASSNKRGNDQYYNPETMDELYARFGYMYYKNGEFAKSVEYFGELFKINQTNAPAYLYASYASEYLYQNTKDKKYLQLAKEYAQKAYSLDSKNKYIKEQCDNL